MTIQLDATTTNVRALGAPRLLAGASSGDRVDFVTHVSLHGSLRLRRRDWLTNACADVNLLGRGGASFPVATKLAAMPHRRGVRVLVNGSEGEPASQKDRVLMQLVPHLVLDGALIVARALAAVRIAIIVHDRSAFESLRRACQERGDAANIVIKRTNTGFVGGEVRAAINGLNGGPAIPSGRRILPVARGIDGRPTFASNVETFAHIALLTGLGVADFARTGSTDEPGTTLLTLVGAVPYAGVIEVPTGVPINTLVGSADLRPTLIGGYHGTWTHDLGDLTVDRTRLKHAGLPLNAGVIACIPPTTCVLDEIVGVSAWLAAESTGQCGPCFFGLPAIARSLASIAAGGGTGQIESLRKHLDVVAGRGACAHPDGSVQFIRSALEAFGTEFERHAETGDCGRPAGRILPLNNRSD